MKKLLLLGIMLLGMGGVIFAADYEIDQKFTSIAALEGKRFIIVNETESKAIYDVKDQNLAYDSYAKAVTGTAYQWVLESLADNADESVRDCYTLRLVKPDGTNHSFWGKTAVYLNSGSPTGFDGLFALDNGTQLGTDVKYGGVWEVKYVESKGFTLKNKAIGGYFDGLGHRPSAEEPAYWTFCTLKEKVLEDTEDPGVKACPSGWTDLIVNGTLTSDETSSFYVGSGETNAPIEISTTAGRINGRGIKVTSKAPATKNWDTQFWFVAPSAMEVGTKLHIEFDYKANIPGKVTTQVHGNPGKFISNNAIGDINFTVNWQHFEKEFTIESDGVKSIAFNMNENMTEAIDFHLDNIVMWSHPNAITKPTRTATDAKVISLNDFSGSTWNATEKTFTGQAGFKWEDLDLSEYQYLIVTSAKNMSTGGYPVAIKDKSGKQVEKDEYGVDFMNMWFGEWNNHNCLCIDLEKLRVSKEFDIYHITDLIIDGGTGFTLGNVYATNQKPNNNKNWGNEDNGDFKVENLPADKYGTICLPWQAAVAGAFAYEISGVAADGISLTRVDGLLEAGKPYIYMTNGNNAGKEKNNIYFYKATAATVATPVENNGLIGTFSAITAPQGDNFYVLSGNKLYYTTDATVNVGANKAYIDKTKIVNKGGEAKAFIDFDEPEATGIDAVATAETLKGGKFYDLSGREVANPTRGLYIVNGKKVLIK